MKEIIVTKNEAGQRLDKLLKKYLNNAPNSFFYKMLRKKNIVLNGKKADGREILTQGDSIKLFLSDDTIGKFSLAKQQPADLVSDGAGLVIVYEDEDILLINKPSGILSQKARSKDRSMVEYVIAYLLGRNEITEEGLRLFKPSVCNRLDRNTSGLIIAGKSLPGSQTMSELLKNRTLQKYYLCAVKGKITEPKRIQGFLKKDEANNTVTVRSQGGVPIETEYLPLAWNDEMTLLKVHLITGKTHQIRAHLASEGHPLLGDPKYGNPSFNAVYKRRYQISHQMLHAYQIVFPPFAGGMQGGFGKDFYRRGAGYLLASDKGDSMGTWNSRGLRGSTLEDMVNRTNEWYLEKGLALIQKIPTPITPVKMDKEHRHITLAYFDQRSTIDYIGAVQGIPICFDAKECVAETFPLQNIHEHQVKFMEEFEHQGGIAFILIYYSSKNILYYMRFEELCVFWNRAKEGGRKSFRFEELDDRFFMEFLRGCYVPYLDAMNLDLEIRDELDKE